MHVELNKFFVGSNISCPSLLMTSFITFQIPWNWVNGVWIHNVAVFCLVLVGLKEPIYDQKKVEHPHKTKSLGPKHPKVYGVLYFTCIYMFLGDIWFWAILVWSHSSRSACACFILNILHMQMANLERIHLFFYRLSL